jgi:hypothetical protein
MCWAKNIPIVRNLVICKCDSYIIITEEQQSVTIRLEQVQNKLVEYKKNILNPNNSQNIGNT